MNAYWSGGLLVAFVVWSIACGIAGYRYESEKCTASDLAHDIAQSLNTIAAQQHVIEVGHTQNTISQGASNAYHSDLTAIDSLYESGGLPAAANSPVNNMSVIPAAAGGICPDSGKSKKYHLTPKQCDDEEAKCNALWNWAQAQAAIK